MKYLSFRNTIYLIITMLSFSFKGNSQNAQGTDTDIMETIIPSGNDAKGSSGTVSYSIGQVFYIYVGESEFKVAQGVQQQEKDKTLEIPDVEVPTSELFIFPNPTTDYVTLSMKGLESELANGIRYYKLYDIQGRLLQQNTVNETETQISLSNLSSSLYILTVYIDNQVLKTFKILKH